MKTKVYFNNSCSICRAEINNYMKHCNIDIDRVDILTCKDSEENRGLNVDNLYKRMFVNVDGKLNVGLKFFIIIWYQSRRY